MNPGSSFRGWASRPASMKLLNLPLYKSARIITTPEKDSYIIENHIWTKNAWKQSTAKFFLYLDDF